MQDVSIQRTEAPVYNSKLHDTLSLRTFLSSFTYSSLSNRGRIRFLREKEMEGYLKFVDKLDATPERETCEIGLIYVPNKKFEHVSEKEIYSVEGGSPAYIDFVNSIGWQVRSFDLFRLFF